MRAQALGIFALAGVLGAASAGAAVLTWSYGLFAASFSLFGDPDTISPEPEHLFLMHVAAPALLGLATVPITLVQGAGWRRVGVIALVSCTTSIVASMLALNGANLQAGVGTFLTVTVGVPALSVFAAWVRGDRDGDDVAAVAGGLASASAVLALLVYSCGPSTLPLALLFGLSAWVVLPALAGLVQGRGTRINGAGSRRRG